MYANVKGLMKSNESKIVCQKENCGEVVYNDGEFAEVQLIGIAVRSGRSINSPSQPNAEWRSLCSIQTPVLHSLGDARWLPIP